ncbi:hypothetical protein J4727_00400 [Providencia rettgeri]|uniref:Uncharacterized protein n=1 Tax=Providencia rettgeri TaxID=587 RepID=A0A939NEH5_PRORE|nr:hypothetical protein [Providencia rettgeri]
MIHYSDFECPYCGQGFPELLDFVDSSGGNFVFKHTLGHGQRSLYLSTLTECAYEQKGNYGFLKLRNSFSILNEVADLARLLLN